MSDLAQILEEELEEAVEVKNKKSLHRYISLLTESMTRKGENRMEHSEFQQELIKIDGRFNLMLAEVREGFRRMDDRFEAMQKRMDERFEAVDKRFEASDKRFETMRDDMNQRFESSDKRIETLRDDINKRSETWDKRFEAIENRLDKLGQQMFRFMVWSFGTTATAAGIIIAVLKLT